MLPLAIFYSPSKGDFNSAFSCYHSLLEREILISTKIAYFLTYIKWGGNLYQSYLNLHHQKVKLKHLLLSAKLQKNWDLANMEFVKHSIKKRNRIGEYKLEWLEPELDVHPKLDVHPGAA